MASTITYRLKPKVHYCTSSLVTGWGLHPSPGTSTEGSGDCSSYCDEGQDALNETDYGFLRSSATAANYTPGRFEHTFGPLPSGLTISKVRIVAYFRASNAGPASIDESPRMKGFVNIAATRYYQTGPTYVIVTETRNRNTQGAAGSFGRYICGEWATNPATASAWTLTDLAEGVFKAGIEAGGIAEGQAGNGIPPTTGGSAASVDLAVVEIEVEATSTDLIIEPIRAILSRHLRLRRRPLKPVRLEVVAPLAHAAPGDVIYAAEPFWPTPGAAGLSALEWDRRPLFVIESEESVATHTATLTAWDLREHYCSFWSPLHTDLGADDQWTGLAWIDQGGGKLVTRAQGGWIWRPGDGLWRDAASGKWRITPWGLLICGGSYSGYTPTTGELTWYPVNNTFSQGTGGEGTSLPNADTVGFTGWTVSKAGTGTVVVKQDSSYLFDVTSFRRAVRLTQGAPVAANYARVYAATAGFATTDRVRVFLKFRNVAGTVGNMWWRLGRTTGGDEWDESAQVWGVAPMWNQVTENLGIGSAKGSLRLVGDHYEYWSSEITIGGAGAQTLIVRLGFEEDSASVDVFAAGFVSAGSSLGSGLPVVRREFIATTNATLVQAGDAVNLGNQLSNPVQSHDRGTLTMMVTPLWDHEDLIDGEQKVAIAFIYHATSNYQDEFCYERIDATTGRWVFTRTVFAGSVTVYFPTSSGAGTLPRYLTPEKLSLRWTSSSGELDLAAKTLTIHRNGVAGAGDISPGDPTISGQYVALGRRVGAGGGISGAPRYYLDGMIAHLEIVPFCLSNTEIARRHAQLSLPALPEDAA